MRFSLYLAVPLAISLLAACARESDITPQNKAKMVTEILLDKPACLAFVERLKAPQSDAEAVARIYREAAAAHCLKPTV